MTIDIGTTSAKVLIVSDTGNVVATAQEFYPTHFPQPGFAVQDPDVVVNGIFKIIRSATQQHPGRLVGIGISSAMHSLMAIDQKGKPLSDLILWSDMRSADHAKRLRRSPAGSAIYHATGTPIHPMSPLCKLIWMREHDPDLLKNAWKFISVKEYLLLKLCNDIAIDYSVASSSGLFDVHQLDWSVDALHAAGVSKDKLGRCVSPYHALKLTADASKALGLDADVPVFPGASDGCLAHLGSDAMGKGQMSVTVGTSGAVRMASPTYAHDSRERIFNYRLDEHGFISGGATNNGTVLLSWFCNNFLDDKSMNLVGFATRACTIEPGASGLLFLPYVFGERAPHYNPDLRGVFFGLAQHHTREHMMRSLLEGICLEVRSIVESVEQSLGDVTEILASGGFIRSPLWIQMMANVLKKTVTLRDVNDASSLGAAMIAFRGAGVKYSFVGMGDEMVYRPDPSTANVYDDLYGVFSRSTRALEAEFSEIVRLQQS